jgi:hypothetical protein
MKDDRECHNKLVVIFLSQVRDQIFAHHPAKCVLQLNRLYEQIMLGIQAWRSHRRFEVKAEPFLNLAHARALRQIEEQDRSSTIGAARMESRQRKSTLICMG